MQTPVTAPHLIDRCSIFTGDDRLFLREMFRRFPKVEENFTRYLLIPPTVRFFQAADELLELKRSGWVKRGFAHFESVLGHSIGASEEAARHAPDGIDGNHCWEMLAVHDIHEVIATDFTPTDPINNDEKKRLEMLASHVIFESPTGMPGMDNRKSLALIAEYNDQKTPESHWAHDCDKLDAVNVALQYEAHVPATAGVFEEFANYAQPRLKTERGREILAEWREDKQARMQEYREWREQRTPMDPARERLGMLYRHLIREGIRRAQSQER